MEKMETLKDVKNSKTKFVSLAICQKDDKSYNTKVITSKNPFKKIDKCNSKLNSVCKTKWEVDMIVGPFDNKSQAEDFHNKWKKKTRGISSRRGRGIELACERKKTIYYDYVQKTC
jgi:hypothetical protein